MKNAFGTPSFPYSAATRCLYKTFSFKVVSSSRKSCKDAHFEHINKHHIIRTPCMAVHVQQKRATMAGIQHGHETQRLSVFNACQSSQFGCKARQRPFGVLSDVKCCVLLRREKRIVHAYMALCTQSHTGLCARIQRFVHAVYAK